MNDPPPFHQYPIVTLVISAPVSSVTNTHTPLKSASLASSFAIRIAKAFAPSWVENLSPVKSGSSMLAPLTRKKYRKSNIQRVNKLVGHLAAPSGYKPRQLVAFPCLA